MIRNADGTVGNVISANKFLGDTNLISKYNLLSSYSSKTKLTTISASGTDDSGNAIDSATYAEPTIMGFMSKMEKFYYAPPSDNLWTITIDADDTDYIDGSSLETLYNRIIAANEMWAKQVNTKWKIDLQKAATKSKNTAKEYIKQFVGQSGIFLAQDVNFSTNQANVNTNVFSQAQQHGAFYNFGNIALSRPNNRKLNINFLISNWDIGDILFDPWISAVTQKGLIEDSNSSIKGRIVIKEYASGLPKNYEGKALAQMYPRKQYVFRNCVPIQRSEIKKNYNPAEAGVFKNSIVNFIFDDYKIDYFY